MQKAILFVALLALSACGPSPALPGPADAGAVLPPAEPSYVFGSRDAPDGGQIVVGLLRKRPETMRLADLVPPADLARYLAEEDRLGDKHVVEPPDAVLIEWDGATYPSWGERAQRLAVATEDFEKRTNIRVSFREVLAHECAGLPIVVVSRRVLETAEERDLEAHESAGGVVVRPKRDRGIELEYAVPDALDEALEASPLVHVFDTDPLGVVSAAREGDDIELELADPRADVSLRDLEDRVLGKGTRTADGRVRLHAPDPALDPFRHFVVVQSTRGDLTLVRGTSVERLVGTPERVVEAGAQARIGSTLALRIHTINSKTGAPVAGEAGTVVLERSNTVLASAPYRTDAAGYAEPVIVVPSTTNAGAATLRVANQVVGTVQVLTDVRVSLVTDRTLYKEDDTVHVRVMVHRAGDGRPVPGAPVTLKLGDSRKQIVTSEHGIGSATFTLAGAKVGPHTLGADAEAAHAAASFRVKAFERPTFLASVDQPALTLRAGEEAPLVLTARYVNDKPMIGADVEVGGMVGVEVRPTRGTTGQDGTLTLVVTGGKRRGGFEIVVTDADGRRQEVGVSFAPPAERKVEVWPLTDPVLGLEATLAVLAKGQDQVELRVDGGTLLTVVLDERGYGRIATTPSGTTLSVDVEGFGNTHAFDVARFDGKRPVVALDQRTARIGETLAGTILARDGRVLVEVERDDLLVRMFHVDVVDGSGRFELALDDALAGLLDVRAHHADDPERLGTHAPVLVTRGRALDVAAAPERAYYRPGETAAVDVAVTDVRGEPTACVLGYWGVDEALLALSDFGEGNEEVFDVLQKRASGQLAALARGTEDRSGAPMDARSLLGAVHSSDRVSYPLTAQRTPYLSAQALQGAMNRHNIRVAELRAAYLRAWETVPLTEINYAWTLRGVLGDLVHGGYLDPGTLIDAWGTPMALWHDVRGYWYAWTSAGPDRAWGTDDDQLATWDGTELYWAMPQRILRFHDFVQRHRRVEGDVEGDVEEVYEEIVETDWDMPFDESFGLAEGLSDAPFDGPSSNGVIGIGGGAGGAFRGRGGSRSTTAGGGGSLSRERPIHVRKDFEPTLCFVPEAIVGPTGKTRVRIPLKDSITTWKLRLVASREDGATGVGYGQVRAGQPLYATPWLATHLTVGDVLDLPVAVRNEQDVAIEAALRVRVSDALEIVGRADAVVAVPAGETSAYVVKLQAVKRGTATVRIEVRDGQHEDVQERIIHVRPYARAVVSVKNGTLTPSAVLTGAMEMAGAGDVRMDLYPTPLAETLSGFEGLIACPHG